MSEIGDGPTVAEVPPVQQQQPNVEGGGDGEDNQLKPEEKAATAAGTPNTTPVSGASTPSTPATPPGKSAPSFKAQFKAFSKFGDTKSDGRHLTLSQSDKWMKQAKVIDGKKITTTDTGIYFKKLKYVYILWDRTIWQVAVTRVVSECHMAKVKAISIRLR
jgi:hypothetical protein